MARIPKHELDELKRSLSLLSLAQSQGHKFKLNRHRFNRHLRVI